MNQNNSSINLVKAIELYHTYLDANDERSIKYKLLSNPLIRKLDVTDLRSITPEKVEDIVSKYEDEFSINNLDLVTNFFRFCTSKALIDTNIFPILEEKYNQKKQEEASRRTFNRPIVPQRDEEEKKLNDERNKLLESLLNPESRLRTSAEIKEYLDSRVMGQEEAKIQLSVLLSMHLGWFRQTKYKSSSPKGIILGPTGVGKTHTIREACDFLKIPYVTVDATSLVPSGIVGLQIEDILLDLVQAAQYILKKNGFEIDRDDDRVIEFARRGLIFLDEFDKLAFRQSVNRHDESNSIYVQRRLLKFVEGASLGIGVRGHLDSKITKSIDTLGILVLVGGAFNGIDSPENRKKRTAELNQLLYSNPNVVVPEDIVNYGFMTELVARFPVFVEYKRLEKADLKQILNNENLSPITVWTAYFEQYQKLLVITDDAKEFIAERAYDLKMGARGLQQVIFPCLANFAYEAGLSEDAELVIDKPKFQNLLNEVYGGKKKNVR